MASENITLYIKGDRNVEVTEQDVFLKDIVSMECSDKKFLPKLQTVKILKLHGNREQRYVVSVLEIIACIHAAYPEVEVQNLGEADIIVTYENQKTPAFGDDENTDFRKTGSRGPFDKCRHCTRYFLYNTLRNDSASIEIRSREKQDCYGGGGSSNLSGGCCM